MSRGKRRQAPGQGKAPLFQRGGNIAGTHFISRLEIGYPELVAVFGEPDLISHPDNPTGAEWIIHGPDGRVAAIYNWYRPPGSSCKETRFWHVGGRGPEAMELVQTAISAYDDMLTQPRPVPPRSRNSLLAS